jgi:hypothetical protein
LALETLKSDQGFVFERFANAFLAAEFPQLRPVGGIHDAGRDAFLHRSEAQADVFIQHSVTESWQSKIRDTIKVLRKHSFPVRELIYCTNQDIQRDADPIRVELRADSVSLDIRDRSWFMSFVETSEGRRGAAEALAKQIVDPLLSSRGVLAGASLALTQEDERVATTYLQLELQDRDPQRGLTKLCTEALVTYVLREASPEDLVPRQAVRDRVATHLAGSNRARANLLADNALSRLVSKNRVKHHTKEDAFALAFSYRELMKARIETMLLSETKLQHCALQQVTVAIKELGIDYQVPEVLVAQDAVRLLEHMICERGRLAAVALVGKGIFSAYRKTVEQFVRERSRNSPDFFKARQRLTDEKLLDILPVVVEKLASSGDADVEARLRTLADAYCLQFMLQQTDDVQRALQTIVNGMTILVDASVIISAMSEACLETPAQRVSQLLRVVHAAGARLIVGDDALNEIDTHIDRVSGAYRAKPRVASAGQVIVRHFDAMLIRAYDVAIKSQRFTGSFDQFVTRFKGRDTPLQDIAEYLSQELNIAYTNLGDVVASLSQEELGALFASWKVRKKRRPWVDEVAHETLVLHDVRAFMIVEAQRRRSLNEATYGHRWWWLVIDGAASRFDRERHGTAVGACVCMSPEFLARYLSLAPQVGTQGAGPRPVPPAALGVAGLGLVPPELRRDAEKIYAESADGPEYLRRRRLRELVNQAAVTAHEDLAPEDTDLDPFGETG